MTAVLNLFDEDSEPYGPKPKPSQIGQPVGRGWKGGKFRDGDKVVDPNPTHGWKTQTLGNNNPIGPPPLDWWMISTTKDEAYRRVIAAMCPERVCRVCGEPSRRMVEAIYSGTTVRTSTSKASTFGGHHAHRETNPIRTTTESWTDCGHDDWRPGVWLDPFNPEAT